MLINSVVTSFRGRRITVLAAMAAACLLFAACTPPAAAADGTDRDTMNFPGQRSNVAGLDSQTNLKSPDCGTDQPLAKIVNTLSRTLGSGTAYLRCGRKPPSAFVTSITGTVRTGRTFESGMRSLVTGRLS